MAENVSSLMNEAKEFEENRKLYKAIKCYEQIVEINPDNIDAWLNKGKLHFFLNHPYNASLCFNKVLEKDSQNQVALEYKEKLRKQYIEDITFDLNKSNIYQVVGAIVLLGGITTMILGIFLLSIPSVVSGIISFIVSFAWFGLSRRFQRIATFIGIITQDS
ncbi:MAG: hypothetical protein JW776_05440 [Candidatus Lokiarchaeota archaeon]|nr:hypothetical protein [Candidatus Lokiarchaeota archaeon]